MFNKSTPQALTRQISLIIFIVLALALAACGAKDNEAGSKFAPLSESAVNLRLAQADPSGQALEVWVDDVEGLYALDMKLHFDPAKLQLADADAEQEGIQIQPGKSPAPDFVAGNSGDNQSGVIHYVVTQVAPRKGFNGSGLIATLLWEGKVDESAVSFGDITLVRQDGQPINTGQDAVSMK